MILFCCFFFIIILTPQYLLLPSFFEHFVHTGVFFWQLSSGLQQLLRSRSVSQQVLLEDEPLCDIYA